MATIYLNEKQYGILKKLISEDLDTELKQTLNDNAVSCIMDLKKSMDRYYTGLKVGYFDEKREDISDIPDKSVFWEVWEKYLEPAYSELFKYMNL